ncbi:MAG: hypothetical protein LCH67_07725 [Bacteroidetes bacterium]|nr:hypothetical protein [Bacteroidota bacterium]
MSQSPKFTSWKKNREFGKVFGGRERLKMKDDIFKRLHSFLKPASFEEKPIVIYDNPSKDFFFPITFEEIKNSLPKEVFDSYTHIWFKKMKRSTFENENWIVSDNVFGGGVNLLVIFPFPKDLRIRESLSKPTQRRIKHFQKYEAQLKYDKKGYFFEFDTLSIKKYYLNYAIIFK